MRCPYCATDLDEHSPECPACRLDLGRAARLLGPVPRIEPGVCDSTGALTPGERKRLKRRTAAITGRFPQVRVQLVFRHFTDGQPIGLHAFWMFNLGAFSTETEKLGGNRNLLLLVDPIAAEASIIPGYGLEPFLTDEELDDLLGMAADEWAGKQWCGGALTLLDGLEALLERASLRTAEALGLSARKAPSDTNFSK